MAKKVTFEPNDNIAPDPTGANPEMLAAMERARNEISGGLDIKASLNTNEEKKTTKKSGGNTPTKRKNSNSLTAREVLTQKEKDNPNPLFMSAKHEIVNDMKLQINELLPTINIDLNNLVISDSLNSLEKHNNLDLVFNSKPTFQVTLPQSCYVTYMEALKYNDIDAITNSTMDEYHTTL